MKEDIYIEKFANRLYEVRDGKVKSARDMSLSLGLAPNYISGLEAAKNYPTMLNFFYICEYLGITPKDFFDYDNEHPQLSQELQTEFVKLDSKSKEYILNMIKEINNRPK